MVLCRCPTQPACAAYRTGPVDCRSGVIAAGESLWQETRRSQREQTCGEFGIRFNQSDERCQSFGVGRGVVRDKQPAPPKDPLDIKPPPRVFRAFRIEKDQVKNFVWLGSEGATCLFMNLSDGQRKTCALKVLGGKGERKKAVLQKV